MKKKILQTFCILLLFAIGFAASADDSELYSKYGGTYYVIDNDGVKWTFTVKDDYKLTALREGMSVDDMYYGKWSSIGGGYVTFNFSDFYAFSPVLRFPDESSNWSTEYLRFTEDGWLYQEYEYMNSKNPNKRLKMNKQ